MRDAERAVGSLYGKSVRSLISVFKIIHCIKYGRTVISFTQFIRAIDILTLNTLEVLDNGVFLTICILRVFFF